MPAFFYIYGFTRNEVSNTVVLILIVTSVNEAANFPHVWYRFFNLA
jgi:hypothetical protein